MKLMGVKVFSNPLNLDLRQRRAEWLLARKGARAGNDLVKRYQDSLCPDVRFTGVLRSKGTLEPRLARLAVVENARNRLAKLGLHFDPRVKSPVSVLENAHHCPHKNTCQVSHRGR